MGSLNPFGGGGGKSGGGSSGAGPGNITPLGGELEGIAGGQAGIAGQQASNAQPFITGGTGQYGAGLTGSLTPAQSALTQFTANENALNTANTYGNLGLPGSTMETMDVGGNNLASLAQTEGIDFQNELMGLDAAQMGNAMLSSAVGSLGAAGSTLGNAGGVYNSQEQANLSSKGNIGQILGGISGAPAGSSGGAGTGNFLSSLFGSGSSGGGGLFSGKSGGAAADAVDAGSFT